MAYIVQRSLHHINSANQFNACAALFNGLAEMFNHGQKGRAILNPYVESLEGYFERVLRIVKDKHDNKD